MTREQRKAAAKARKEAAIAKRKGPAAPGELPPSSSEDEEDEIMPANPNHTAAARSQASNPKVVDESTPARNGFTKRISNGRRTISNVGVSHR